MVEDSRLFAQCTVHPPREQEAPATQDCAWDRLCGDGAWKRDIELGLSASILTGSMRWRVTLNGRVIPRMTSNATMTRRLILREIAH